MEEVCSAGVFAFGADVKAPCPALTLGEGKALCGLVLLEGKKFPPEQQLIRKGLGIGCGCSMPDESTTDEQIETFDRASEAKMFGA